MIRDYILTLVAHEKKFILIGPQSVTKYKETFHLIRDGEMWLGYGFDKGDAYFSIPKESARNFAQGVYSERTGLVHFRNCVWVTNLDIRKRHEEQILFRRYKPEDYPSYTNFDGIDVAKVSDIPCDYPGKMGVPINYLDRYNPDQFEIVGLGEGDLAKEIGITRNHEGTFKRPFARIVIRNLHPEQPKEA